MGYDTTHCYNKRSPPFYTTYETEYRNFHKTRSPLIQKNKKIDRITRIFTEDKK
jgi:hypothetical protein